ATRRFIRNLSLAEFGESRKDREGSTEKEDELLKMFQSFMISKLKEKIPPRSFTTVLGDIANGQNFKNNKSREKFLRYLLWNVGTV
ncbi:hypothetical protein PFISCL1PPCAC_16890, partial [Pristionchus fissidentatus]